MPPSAPYSDRRCSSAYAGRRRPPLRRRGRSRGSRSTARSPTHVRRGPNSQQARLRAHTKTSSSPAPGSPRLERPKAWRPRSSSRATTRARRSRCFRSPEPSAARCGSPSFSAARIPTSISACSAPVPPGRARTSPPCSARPAAARRRASTPSCSAINRCNGAASPIRWRFARASRARVSPTRAPCQPISAPG